MAEITYSDIGVRLNSGVPVILGLGAQEQHGPHLPLGTDTLIVDRLAAALADTLPALRLPTLPFGAPSRPRSGGGDRFPAPSLALPTLFAVIEELVSGTFEAGARSVIVVSWHWENAQVMWDAVRRAHVRYGRPALIFDSPADFLKGAILQDLFPEGFPGWVADHAGRLETALLAFLAPAQTRPAGSPSGFENREYDVLPTPLQAVPSDGVFYPPGDPSPELGRRCFDELVSQMLSVCRKEIPEAGKPGPVAEREVR